MRNRRLALCTGLAGVAALLVACNSNSTSPQTKTVTVTATASVPANPTAPVTVSTNAPQSQVSVTLDTTVLKQIAAQFGGATTITMSDLAAKDYGQLGSSIQTDLNGAKGLIGVLSFSFQTSGSSQLADRVHFDAASSGGDPTISYAIVGTDPCPSQNTVNMAYFNALANRWDQNPTSLLTKSSGLITGSFSVSFPMPNPYIFAFMCTGGSIGNINVSGITG